MPTWDEMKKWSVTELIKEELEAGSDEDKPADVADRVTDRLWEFWADGAEWAETDIRKNCREAIRQQVVKRGKRPKATITIGRTGEIIDIPARVGVPMVDEFLEGDPQARRVYQQKLWWEIPWSLFFLVMDAIARQGSILMQESRAMREVAKLYPQFPDTETPDEACRLAGLDPMDFKLLIDIG